MCRASKRDLECPVFRPTLEDVRSMTFDQYVEKMEPEWLHIGICRIVAPEGWTPRAEGYDNLDDLVLPRPIRQHATGRQGLYRTLLVEERSMSLEKFKEITNEGIHSAPKDVDSSVLERKFWRNLPMNPPLYGADVAGSMFDDRQRHWNPKYLSSLLSSTLRKAGAAIPGVTQPYLYVGAWRSFFAWHTEDMDLHSVNYLHCGSPKTWYVIPPHARERFELLASTLCPELHRNCPEFLRHKEILLSPALLAAHNIPVVKTTHNPREFVVVGPGAYHAGFNHGFNLAESVNFATKSWVSVGAYAGFCTCREDSVKIDMRLFAEYMDPETAEEVFDSYESSDDDDEDDSSISADKDPKKGCKLHINYGFHSYEDSEEGKSNSETSRFTDCSEVSLSRIHGSKPTKTESTSAVCQSAESKISRTKSPRIDTEVIAEPLRHLNRNHQQSGSNVEKIINSNSVVKSNSSILSGNLQEKRIGQCADVRRQKCRPKSGRKSKSPTIQENAISMKSRKSPASVGVVTKASCSEKNINGIKAPTEAPTRSMVKRGAATAWYALFDSILPALKRAKS